MITLLNIVISAEDITDYLESELERKPTKEEMEKFRACIIRDMPQWLRDNARWWSREAKDELSKVF